MQDLAPSQPTIHEQLPSAAAEPGTDLRLVVADMDGTLLDGHGNVPDTLWPLLDELTSRGIVFAPASGRQYATLAHLFQRASDGMPFVAENGTYVVRDGHELSSTILARDFVAGALDLLRGLAEATHDLGVVLCGKRSAYVERTDERFLAEVRKYYHALEIVDDLKAPDDDVLKLAVFDFGDAATGTAPELAPIRSEQQQVVVSSEHWIDIMAARANKGAAVRQLQRELGITRAQTAAFGDYLNDLELMDNAGLSFAMANAHPEVLARARFVAPANTEDGVVTVLTRLLDGARDAA